MEELAAQNVTPVPGAGVTAVRQHAMYSLVGGHPVELSKGIGPREPEGETQGQGAPPAPENEAERRRRESVLEAGSDAAAKRWHGAAVARAARSGTAAVVDARPGP